MTTAVGRSRHAGGLAACARSATGIAVAVLLALCTGAAPASGADLAGQWHLDGPDRAVPDSSGNGHDGSFGRGSSYQQPGKFGPAAARFTHGHTWVDIPTGPGLEPAVLSVAAWVRAIRPGPIGYIVAKGGTCTGPAASYALYTGVSGGPEFYISDGAATWHSPVAPDAIWDDEWHAVVGTYDGVAVRLYVDGREVGAGTPVT